MMQMSKKPFGTLPDGRETNLYVLENSGGMRVLLSDYGGTIVGIQLPEAGGKLVDVCLGHADVAGYAGDSAYFGKLVGRNANRIPGAAIELDGVTYFLEKNNGENNLHGGSKGLHSRVFDAWFVQSGPNASLYLSCEIAHMEDGLPGNLRVDVIYTLTEDNTLLIDYEAIPDRTTLINLTNHVYFNLAGHASGPIDGQVLTLNADFYNPATPDCLITGEVRAVEGTPFDFTHGARFENGFASGDAQITQFGGYDHNLCLAGREYRLAGGAIDPASGRFLEFYTTLPCVQLYTYNRPGAGGSYKEGATYGVHQGFCLESQNTPAAASFPWLRSPVYLAGEVYRETTAYRFGTQVR